MGDAGGLLPNPTARQYFAARASLAQHAGALGLPSSPLVVPHERISCGDHEPDLLSQSLTRPRFDVAWPLARLASERGTVMPRKRRRPGRSRNLGGRRGQGQAGRAETGNRRRQNAPAARSKSRRGIGPRKKVFGPGRLVPLDRDAKVRVMMVARALTRHQEKGKAYGKIGAKALAVSPRCSGAPAPPRGAAALDQG